MMLAASVFEVRANGFEISWWEVAYLRHIYLTIMGIL